MKFYRITSSASGAFIVAVLMFIAVVATPQATSATPGEWFSDPTASTALVDILGVLDDAESNEAVSEMNDAVSPVPVESRLMSRYGMRRGRTTGRPTFHAGLDFYAPRGTPVYAAMSGVVEVVSRNTVGNGTFAGYGNAIVIYHEEEDLWTFYAHLDEASVAPGTKVEAGDVIGAVGNTSNRRFIGMGVHLHFEVRHRSHDGAAPFPGRYRVNNIDPQIWLDDHGVTFNADGHLVKDPENFAETASESTPIPTA